MPGRRLTAWLLLTVLLAACLPMAEQSPGPTGVMPTAVQVGTPLPTRIPFPPGQLVDYIAQTGDTLPAVAAHFHTTVDEIRQANPGIPDYATTLPPGYPMRIPAYYVPLTSLPFPILADSEVVNGPSAVGFDVRSEIESRPGYLSQLSDYAFRRTRPAWEVIEVVARNYSLHPRLLLTLLEYQTHALTKPFPDEGDETYPLGYENTRFRGLYRQLLWAAEMLNDGYYGWRMGTLEDFDTRDGFLVRPDPWLNAGTVALQMLFAALEPQEDYQLAISPEGLLQTYLQLWGEPSSYAIELIPANLQQPELSLPFASNRTWSYTAGPHYSWGTSLPLGALDFAPPSPETGCYPSLEWVTAPAAGLVVRSGEASVVLDLDGDADERTGWVIFFFHIATAERIAAGTQVDKGDPIGHPSCEGGQSTGTHVHIARRFNGEWIPAGGALPFVLDGWVASYGAEPYEGTLTRGSRVVPASVASSAENRVSAGE